MPACPGVYIRMHEREKELSEKVTMIYIALVPGNIYSCTHDLALPRSDRIVATKLNWFESDCCCKDWMLPSLCGVEWVHEDLSRAK